MQKVSVMTTMYHSLIHFYCCKVYNELTVLFLLVVLEQASPLPVCPGDNITLICTVTVPENQVPSLSWVNPKNRTHDREVYTVVSSNNSKTGSVGGFTTAFIKGNDTTIVSSAILSMVTEQDEENKAIACIHDTEEKVSNITLSGVN